MPLVLSLERRLRRRVAQAAVFIALKRLERKGLVSSRLHEPNDGRARRYFKVTRPGLAAVEANRVEHSRLWHGLGRCGASRRHNSLPVVRSRAIWPNSPKFDGGRLGHGPRTDGCAGNA